jgi:hypothetical protein
MCLWRKRRADIAHLIATRIVIYSQTASVAGTGGVSFRFRGRRGRCAGLGGGASRLSSTTRSATSLSSSSI